MPKVRNAEMSFLYVTLHLVLFYISTKYNQNILKSIRVIERTWNLFQTKQREITPKIRKPQLSFLYVTHRLVLFYISTKYHQNIPKGIRITERTRNQCIITVIYKRDNAKSKKGRVVILVCDMQSGPVLHFYQVPRNIPKGIQLTERKQNVFQTKQREIIPKVRKPECHSCTWHVTLSCSTFLSSIIKIYQRVFDLQCGH